MKINLTRQIELGLIRCNEPALDDGGDFEASAAAPVVSTGGGDNTPTSSAPAEQVVDVAPASSENWDELSDSPEVEGVEELTEVVAAVTAPAPPPVEPAPPVAIVPPVVKAPETPVAAVAPVAPVVTPAATPETPEAVQAREYNEVISRARTELEQRYQLSEEDAQLIHTEPEKVLPRIAATLAADMVQVALSQVAKMLPQAIMMTNRRDQQIRDGEDAFHKEWPDLKAHQEVVLRLGQDYRARHPQASREQFIREVGAQAAIALRLPMDPVTGKILVAPAVVPQQRYQPPRNGGVTPMKAGGPRNEFEDLLDDPNDL